MEQIEKQIKDYLVNKKITDIEFYVISPNYLCPDPDHVWILAGGVELKFDEDKFAFAWSQEKEFYDINTNDIKELTGDLNLDFLEAKNIKGINSLTGKSIKDIEFKWNFYQDMDENFEVIEEF